VHRRFRLVRLGAVVGLCALAGAAAGIAGSAAAPSSKAKKGSTSGREHHLRGFGRHGPPVHADAVVLNKAGNGFITQTEDTGKVKSVSGDKLTITEGVGNVTYKDVTLTITSNATILRNFAKAQLSDLKTGDFVHVSQSSEGTFVLASDASHRPGRGGFGPHDGPGGEARGEGGPGRPGPGPPA
jgi:hypothetical protein